MWALPTPQKTRKKPFMLCRDYVSLRVGEVLQHIEKYQYKLASIVVSSSDGASEFFYTRPYIETLQMGPNDAPRI
jgi:hypothetical protein